MRLKIELTTNGEVVKLPSNNHHIVRGFIFDKLGDVGDKIHDTYSDYSISTLRGGILNKDEKELIIDENETTYFIFSAISDTVIMKLIGSIATNKSFGYGIDISRITPINANVDVDAKRFKMLTPIYLNDNGVDVTIRDDRFLEVLNLRTKRKLLKYMKNNNLNFNLDDFKIEIDLTKPNKTIKRYLHLKNNKPIPRQCTLGEFIITGSKEVYEFIYNVGLGEANGMGFGIVFEPNNRKYYF